MNLYERSVRLALRAYKLTLSPLIGRQCRFLPTCSEYARRGPDRPRPLARRPGSPPAACAGAIPGAARAIDPAASAAGETAQRSCETM